jgi:hypothetical protein
VDAVTHVLAGACIARTGLNHKTALATLTFILAAEAPDLDVLARLKGPVPGFVHDRGFTHSFVGVALVSVAVVFFMYLVWRLGGLKGKDLHSTPRWWLLFGFAYLAGLSHILLDFITETEGKELPALTEEQGEVSGYRVRLVKFVEVQGVELNYSERIAPAKGLSYGGKITLLSGMQSAEEFSTLTHEIAHLCGAEIYVALAS